MAINRGPMVDADSREAMRATFGKRKPEFTGEKSQ
jgi:hypothetical protein